MIFQCFLWESYLKKIGPDCFSQDSKMIVNKTLKKISVNNEIVEVFTKLLFQPDPDSIQDQGCLGIISFWLQRGATRYTTLLNPNWFKFVTWTSL